ASRGRRRLAPVVAAQLALVPGPVKEERAAADARGVRLREAEDELHGNGGIQGVAAALLDRVAGFRGERMRRRHHEAARLDGIAREQRGAKNKKGSLRRP